MNESRTWPTLFNSPLECGVRSTALLLAAYPRSCDLQRLVQYDYLVLHSADVEGGPPSIHPATPHRSGELIVRRRLVATGLNLMAHRLVVEKHFTAQGISYTAGEYAYVFLDSLTTEYAKRLQNRAEWVVGRFQSISDESLGEYVRARWSSWGAEFVREALVRGIE